MAVRLLLNVVDTLPLWGGGVARLKKVCVPKIGLKFRAR